MRFMGLAGLAAICAEAVLASAPGISILPEARPGSVPQTPFVRPLLRPGDEDAPVRKNPPVVRWKADEADDVPVLAEGDADPDQEALIAAAEAESGAEDRPGIAPVVARLNVSPFPVPRPKVVFRTRTPAPAPEVVVAAAVIAPPVTAPPAPTPRPKGLLAMFRKPDKPVTYPAKGSVCGDPAIRGQVVPPIPAKLRGCGLQNPVRITEVDGVALSTPATVGCGTARALRSWVSGTVKPVFGERGGGVAGLRVAASYSCRTRNNIPGAKVSEHGRGNAIDISAIRLRDGTIVSVLKGWRNAHWGPLMKAVHAKACGTFGTVLGPNSDRHHQDHFHFDVARHGYGTYCR